MHRTSFTVRPTSYDRTTMVVRPYDVGRTLVRRWSDGKRSVLQRQQNKL
ncbi:MAG: hypothetical protein LBM62_07435 [Mediterranea sp.]|nr:hypothetical protein [Mediterranea sp.]